MKLLDDYPLSCIWLLGCTYAASLFEMFWSLRRW